MEANCRISFRIRVLGLIFLIMAVADNKTFAADASFIEDLNTISTVSTTIPKNGDVNPYGVARVPRSKGDLVEGRFLYQ